MYKFIFLILVFLSLIPRALHSQDDAEPIGHPVIYYDTVRFMVAVINQDGDTIDVIGEGGGVTAQEVVDSILSYLHKIDSLVFNGSNGSEWLYGKLANDTNENFLTYHMLKEGVKLQIGGEFYIWARNASGGVIENGTYVRFAGVTGETPDIDIAGCGSPDSARCIGATTHEFAINESGFVTVRGKINEVDRSWSTPGYIEYLSHNGKSQITPPTFPNSCRIVGTTLRANSNGISYVWIEDVPWNIPQHSIYFSGVNRQRSADTNFQYIDSTNTLKVNNIEIDTLIINGDTITKFSNVIFSIALSDSSSELTISNGDSWDATCNYTIDSIRIGVNSAPTGSAITLDIKKAGVSIFSTLISIDDGETSSVTAATDYVLTTTSINYNDRMQALVNSVGITYGGSGLKLYIYGKKN